MGLPMQVLSSPPEERCCDRHGWAVVVMRQDLPIEVAVPLRNGGTYSPGTRPGTYQEGGKRTPRILIRR